MALILVVLLSDWVLMLAVFERRDLTIILAFALTLDLTLALEET